MTDAARSVDIYLENRLKETYLQKAQSHIDHGEWNSSLTPPSLVLPTTKEHFAAESAGLGTGTEGYIVYEASPIGSSRLYFDVPYDGPNKFDVTGTGDLVISYDDPPAHSDNPDWNVSVDQPPVLQLTLVNHVEGMAITLDQFSLENGDWDTEPPAHIPPGGQVQLQVKPRPDLSSPFKTEVLGAFHYLADPHGEWLVAFNAQLFLWMITSGKCWSPADGMAGPWTTSTQSDDTSDLPTGSLAWRCTVTWKP